MASSEKAGALKNAFVDAIANELGEESMAQAGAMENAKLAGKLGLPVGDQASVIHDYGRGVTSLVNDGVGEIVGINPQYGTINVFTEPEMAMPISERNVMGEGFMGLNKPTGYGIYGERSLAPMQGAPGPVGRRALTEADRVRYNPRMNSNMRQVQLK